MNRDNFSTLELVEIADALEMQLLLKNTSDGKEYIIDYPEEQRSVILILCFVLGYHKKTE
uniref:hypothetical protein n=1 Tax=Agathobacter sp. TaxID=2021311 RepID=UPI004055A73E